MFSIVSGGGGQYRAPAHFAIVTSKPLVPWRGAEAASWRPCIYPAACRVHDGEVLPADGDVPGVNHFVHTSGGAVDVVDLSDDTAGLGQAVNEQQELSMSDEGRGSLAAFYAAQGRVVQFTVAQGDCAPDCVAIDRGLPSRPQTWKRIRQEVASTMMGLRNAVWYRTAFQACQEFAPLDVPAAQQSDASSSDSDNDVDEGVEGSAADAGEPGEAPEELKRTRAALAWCLSRAAGANVGENSVPMEVVDKHAAKLSAEDVKELLEVHAKVKTVKGPKRLEGLRKAQLLSTRILVGDAYADFIGGALRKDSAHTYCKCCNVFQICVVMCSVLLLCCAMHTIYHRMSRCVCVIVALGSVKLLIMSG